MDESLAVDTTEDLGITSSVDSTLEDIKKLRVIDKELAQANYGTQSNYEDIPSEKKKAIDEKEIEENTVAKIKSNKDTKDESKIEQLV